MVLILLETAEEFLEMAGVAMLVYALTRYMSVCMKGFEVRIGEETEPSPAASAVAADMSNAA